MQKQTIKQTYHYVNMNPELRWQCVYMGRMDAKCCLCSPEDIEDNQNVLSPSSGAWNGKE